MLFIGLILTLSFIGTLFIFALIHCKKELEIIPLVLFLLIVVIGSLSAQLLYERGVENGRKDIASGRVKYEVKENTEKTYIWKMKKDNEQ